MKNLHFLVFSILILGNSCKSSLVKNSEIANTKSTQINNEKPATKWKLIFSDEFKSKGSFDEKKWSYAPRWSPAWAKYLTPSQDYVSVSSGNLNLTMDNKKIEGDNVPYHSGGIQTTGKFNLLYGKVEVRAKFNKGKGSWPAIWMMPETLVSYGDWPNSGEIDIMEHVNNEDIIHQTIHSGATTDINGGSKATKTTKYNSEDFNTYSIIWEPTKIEFYVNDTLQYTYAKQINATSKEWPFDKPFYIILNQSGGAGWPGAILDSDLPFQMQVDYVRVFSSEHTILKK